VSAVVTTLPTADSSFSPPPWARYVLDFERPSEPKPCPECGVTPGEYEESQLSIGWFAVRGAARLCDDCAASLIPGPLQEVREHLDFVDTEACLVARPPSGLLWDGPTPEPDRLERLCVQLMIVKLSEHYLGRLGKYLTILEDSP
jgi:hypothetical protein